MFWMGKHITDEEKIDYIYKTLKHQKRVFIIRMFLKICIIWFIIYFYLYIIPTINFNLTDIINKNLTPHILPIMTNLTQEMTKNLQDSLWDQVKQNMNNIDSNLINQLKQTNASDSGSINQINQNINNIDPNLINQLKNIK